MERKLLNRFMIPCFVCGYTDIYPLHIVEYRFGIRYRKTLKTNLNMSLSIHITNGYE